ncbi:MAG: restriction endonuclease subunit S [Anaerolineales bacterium]|nr:restriction endonuclease subunit S [Anaerolineales bacterium]
MTQISNGDLPPGWVWKTLAEVGRIYSGGTPSTTDPYNFDGGIRWITPADLSGYDKKLISHGRRDISEKGLRSSSATIIPKGSVLFSSRAPVGYVAIAENEVTTNQGFKSIAPFDFVSSDFLYYYLKSIKNLAESQASGTTFLEISKAKFAQLPIPLPPLAEQERIVARIEALFAQLYAGVAALEAVRGQVKRYRQAVLQAAVEGKLTRGWNYQLEQNANESQKYNENTPGISPNQIDIPDHWCWVNLGKVANCIDPQPSHRTPPEEPFGIPYIGIGDIDSKGRIKVDTARKVSPKVLEEHKTRYSLRDGDFVFGKIGTLGKPAKLYSPYEYTLSANVILIQPDPVFVDPKFVYFYAASTFVEKLLQRESRATTQAAFGIQRVRLLPFPLPPMSEQKRIVEEIERRLSLAEQVEETIIQSLRQATRLRQSILQRAFTGKL